MSAIDDLFTLDSAAHSGCCPPTCCLSSLLDSVVLGDNCETLASMPAESVDLVVTSPPYDDLRTYGGHSWDFYGVAWLLKRVLKPGGVIVWVVNDQTKDGSETGTSMEQALHFRRIGLRLHDTMIYQKMNYLPQTAPARYDQVWEYAFVLSKGSPKTGNMIADVPNAKAGKSQNTRKGTLPSGEADRRTFMTYGEKKRRTNIWPYAVGGKGLGHPAPFPLPFASDCVATWSNPGDLVLDPFAGSGTTLKAAKDLGRRFVGIEINPEYVEICQRRIA